MIIFVYEFTGAASSIGAFHDSLQTEGWSILTAIIDDLRSISEIEVVSILNRDLRSKNPDSRFVLIDARDEESTFRKLAGKADFTIVIAPEFDDILGRRCEWVEQEGGRLLGSSISSIRLTADKYALGQCLKQNRIAIPDCSLFNETQQVENFWPRLAAVVKPRFGAGSVETHLVRDREEWTRLTEMAGSQHWPGEMIVQPFVPGRPASVTFLLGPNGRMALPAASQIFSDDGRFHYRGGLVPLRGDLTLRAQRLATRAIEAVQGLRGYVGVDLVLGPAPDGSEDWVIEINPRLTTSYIGLRALAEFNLAQALIDIVIGKEVKPLKWRKGQVQFSCDGRVNSELSHG